MSVIVKVSKVYENEGKNKNGEDFTKYNFYGKAEDGSDFKASSFAPVGDGVKEGETYKFEIEKKGQYVNVKSVNAADGTKTEAPKKKEQVLPGEEPEVATQNTTNNTTTQEKPDWDKINKEKELSIFKSVAMQEASKEMENVLNVPGVLDGVKSVKDYLKVKKEVYEGNLKMLTS